MAVEDSIKEMDWTGGSLFEAFLHEVGVDPQHLSAADHAHYSTELRGMPVFAQMTGQDRASDASSLGARFGRWHVGVRSSLWRLLLSLAHTIERLATGTQIGWDAVYSALIDVLRALPSLPVSRLSDDERDVYAAVTLAAHAGLDPTAANVASLLDDAQAGSCEALLDGLVQRHVLTERSGFYRAVF